MSNQSNSREPPNTNNAAKAGDNTSIAFGSDAIAEQISRLEVSYMAIVPGSSYRGLHDSIVNYLGNKRPELLVCLHEEHAVSIAHGYAKVAGKPMAAGLHANVGLMHATMAIYNAFCERVPMLLLGATGPLDAEKRRPWIDWIHTAVDQAALIRPFIKFDDQPLSAQAAVDSVVQAVASTRAKPCAPVYVCLDSLVQEDEVDASALRFPETERYLKVRLPGPSFEDVSQLASLLEFSRRPLLLLGRVGREQSDWAARITLAQQCDARVLTDLKQAAAFPTKHPLHACAPSVFITPEATKLLQNADLIVSFDWVDLAGTLQSASSEKREPSAKVVHISLDFALHNGWSKDHFGLPPVDLPIHADPDRTVYALLGALKSKSAHDSNGWQNSIPIPDNTLKSADVSTEAQEIFMSDLANAMSAAFPPDDTCLVRVPLGWKGEHLRITHPFGFMGMDGGAGIGSGPGQVVGTSLALREIGSRLTAVAVLGDGDFMMGSSALWTAARYKLPLVVVVANNGSYFNDEVHQERVARRRGRPLENKWIGMRLDDPAPDAHKIAQGLGCTVAIEPQLTDKSQLRDALAGAASAAKAGKCVVLDVKVLPEGYSSALGRS